MDEIADQSAIGYMLKLFVIAMFLLIFWLLEAVWQRDKRWIIPILIFPPLLIPAVIHAWEFARARCFFTALFIVIVLLAGAVANYNFALQLWIIVRDLSIWPYYLLQQLLKIM